MHHVWYLHHGLSYIRLLLIQLKILVGDLLKGHLGSDDVIRDHQQFFANKSQLKRATDIGVVSLSLVLSRSIAWYPTWPTRVNIWPWCDLDLRSSIDLLRSRGIYMFWCALTSGQAHQNIETYNRVKHDGGRIRSLAFLVQRLLAKKTFCPKKLFWCFFLPLAPKPLMLAKIWWHISESTSQ